MKARIETAAAYLLFGLGMTLLLSSNLIVPQNAFADSGCGCATCDSKCDATQGGDPDSSACLTCIASGDCCNTDPTCGTKTDDCYKAIGGIACAGNSKCDAGCVVSAPLCVQIFAGSPSCSQGGTSGCFFCYCTTTTILKVTFCNCT
jgi:hypothetical protein